MAGISAETISIERLKTAAGQRVFEKGQAYFLARRVEIEEATDQHALCTVRGNHPYFVEIQLVNNYLQLRCDCQYSFKSTICEHEVAAVLGLREYLRTNQIPAWKSQLSRLLSTHKPGSRRGAAPSQYLLFFSLQPISQTAYQSWKIVPYQLPISNIAPEFRPQVNHEVEHPLVGNREAVQKALAGVSNLSVQVRVPYQALNPAGCLNCPNETVTLANVLLERSRAYTYYFNPAFPITDYLTLIRATASPLYLGEANNPIQQEIEILPDPGEIRIQMQREKAGVCLSAKVVFADRVLPLSSGGFSQISASPVWLVSGQYLFQVKKTNADILAIFLDTPELVVRPQEEQEFLEKFYLPLADQFPIDGDVVSWESIQAEPVRRLYLTDQDGNLAAQLRFGYGPYELAYDPQLPDKTLIRKPDSWTLVRVDRQPEYESETYRLLSTSAYGLKKNPQNAQPGVFSLRARIHPVDFLLHSIPKLAEDGFEIYGEESLKTPRVNRNQPVLSFNVSSGIDWFDVKAVVAFGDTEVPFNELRRLLRKRERFVKLADGTVGEIPEEWIERYRHLFSLGQETADGIRMSSHHLTLIDGLLAGVEQVNTDAEFKRRRQRLREFTGINTREIPQGFSGELRPYQKAGLEWLHFLHEFNFGGCLADDMGLGKTIQVLAFFQSLKEEHPAEPLPANLVVVPRSLLVNWQREAARFTPGLKLLVYFDKDRIKDTSTFDNYDVILTTYGVMLRDVEILAGYAFHYILLDESQTIKNPLAQTAKAARLLKGSNRLVLTGTPIENSTMELWSQFAFLNPGLLGNLEYFKDKFALPIEKKTDEKKAQFLRQIVFPFILRRTKDQVAPELPPRTERILYCDMEPAQRKLYNKTRDYYRGVLMGMLENEGMGQTRMKILEGLLRLRQICNHPLLIDDKFRGESAKFELLLETLDTLRSEGHKALVFSQFVQMLSILRRSLDLQKIPYVYLDGQTRNRQERVDQFQEGPKIPLFLISLKAGGVGLNLTAADYVIHIDPWWNPAVEMQASDRTHRIGQEKPVFVYKLIARDSVEEKILQLQERKKTLVDQLITTESSFLKSLTAADIETLFSI